MFPQMLHMQSVDFGGRLFANKKVSPRINGVIQYLFIMLDRGCILMLTDNHIPAHHINM